jgi:hypothetical protein
MNFIKLITLIAVGLAIGMGSLALAEDAAQKAPAGVKHSHKVAMHGAHLSKLIGTIESIDTTGGQLVLKEKDGKTQNFILDKEVKIHAGNRTAELSQLKPGERVSVRFDAKTNTAKGIYLLASKKK